MTSVVLGARDGSDALTKPAETEEILTPGDSLSNPADLVLKAAEILEREMAAGALAAQRAYPMTRELPLQGGASPLPSGAEAILMEIQMLMANVAALTASGRQNPAAGMFDDGGLPVLRPRETVRGGDPAQIFLKLHNDSLQTVPVTLHNSDLISPNGHIIPAHQVALLPGEITLAPDAVTNAQITVQTPAGTPPGVYSGLLTAPALSYLRAIIAVPVE